MSLADDFLSGVTGKTFDYAGIFLPPGYLWANGQAVSRATYARLLSVICLSVTGNTTSGNATIASVTVDLTAMDHSPVGWPLSGPGIPAGATVLSVTSNSITMSANATITATAATVILAPYGVGDGSTTFNVPDARGRVIAGRDDMGKSAASRMTSAGGGVGTRLGISAGTETFTLTATHLPVHNHGVNDAGHTHVITDPGHVHTLTDPGHNHQSQVNNYPLSNQGTGTSTPYNGAGAATGGSANIAATTGITMAAKVTGITANAITTGITTQNAGSGNALAVMQPTIVMHKIIKT
jgi:microcystin-dependent protein